MSSSTPDGRRNPGDQQLPTAPLRGLPIEEQTLPALLQRQAAVHGSRTLLRFDGLERSFDEMASAVAAAAGCLSAAGIVSGDRVALMCENRIETLDFILGCSWLGAVPVPLNTALRGEQLAHQLGNSGARVLGMDSVLLEVLDVIPPPPSLEAVWALDGVPSQIPDGYVVTGPPPPGEPVAPAAAQPGQTAAILYTSGTTGLSKGVCCPHAQFYWWGVIMGEVLDLGEDDVLYTCLPLFHTNALNAFVQALMAGAVFHLGARFSASRFWARAGEAGATVTYLLGAMVSILMSAPVSPADTAHRVTRALAPGTPVSIFDGFRDRFGVQLVEAYGSTETNCTIAAPWRDQRAGSMGRALADFVVQVVDEHDTPVPDGVAGELVIRHLPPYAFATGYWNMAQQTVDAWRNLWFHTGDRVVRDADGRYRFLDRLKDAIRRRGENISSFEVEQVLLTHPSVAAAAVFPVASGLAEDEVAAAVVVMMGEDLDLVGLIRHCEPRLAYFAIPRYVVAVAELPLTANGKVRKSVLRDEGVTADMWDREAAGVTLRRIGR